VLAEDRLFATLDPVTRRLALPGAMVLLSDTVGFIQKLPTQLVAAFRATLEELEDADLLLHVVDVAHPSAFEQTKSVDKTLDELGLAERPRLAVLNKVDLLVSEEGVRPETATEAAALVRPAGAPPGGVVLVSATRRWGLDELKRAIEAALAGLPGPAGAVPHGEARVGAEPAPMAATAANG
jgi:GTP-binding protein HflX